MSRRTVIAMLELLASDAGGRASAIESGYRSLVRFDGGDADFGVEISIESGCLQPGARADARLSFWAGDELGELNRGRRFELREGARIVGVGEILEVLPG